MKGDAPAFWRLRLLAVQSEPAGFAESAAEHEALGIAGTEARIEAGNGENFIMGAFDAGRLIGTAGFYREQKEKRRQMAGFGVSLFTPTIGRRELAGR